MWRDRLHNCIKLLTIKIKSFLYALFLIGLMVLALPTQAQDRSVTGSIKDSLGETVPGATIIEKGTQNGVISDIDGNFKIVLTSDNATLSISFVGYKTQEVIVGARSIIDVVVEEDIEQLAEIVVVGYGTQEAKDVTGVVATVREKDFNAGVIASGDQLISGKVAGVSVTPSNEPGGSANIVIRGVTSLNGGQQPLIVVDGVILDNSGYGGGRNALNFINPSDIESMTILKDASAAAIYGARGAAGVILITTKSGESGKAKLTIDGYYSYANPNMDFGFLSPANFRAVMFNENESILPLLGNDNTVWVDEVVQPIASQNYNISLTGGNDKTNYSISLNHMNINGVVKNSQNRITRASVKLTTKALNDNLTISVQQRVSFTTDNFSSNVTGTALAFDPTRPVYDAENERFGGYWEWQEGLAPSNPVSTIDQIQNLGETRRSFTAFTAGYKLPFLEGLSVHVTASADFRDGKSQFFRPTTHLQGLDSLGYMSVGVNKGYTYNVEPYISYQTDIESINSSLEVMGGYSYQDVGRENFGYSGNKLITNVFSFNNASVIDKETLSPWAINPTRNQLQAYYGRINFSMKDKYLLTSNIRYDGSTKFGPNNRYGVFPSVALGWRMINEDFLSFLEGTFTDMKLRIGWGKLGNQSIGDYLYEKFYFLSTNDARYQFGNTYYNMLRPTGVDPNIQWEETSTTNIGLDFSLLKSRLSGSLDFYNKVTSSLLASVAVPAFTNVSDVVTTNIAEMYNRGIELGLNAVVYDLKDFNWNLNFNAAWNKNEITKLDRSDDSPGLNVGGISGDVGQTIKIWRVGEAYDAFYTYVRDPNGVSLGGETYQDVLTVDTNNDGIPDSGDGIINEDDLQVVGKPAPDFLLGLTSSMSYKNFGLDFTMRSNIGNDVYNNTASANGYYEQLLQGGIINNIHESVLKTNYNGRQLHSDFYVENASFLVLDNITLSYRYNKLDFMNAKVYLTAQNLFTLSGYSGPNPEISNGIDNNLYPRSTTFLIGLNMSF